MNALQPEAELRGAAMSGSADSADMAAEERLEVTRRLMRAALAGDAVELASAIGQAERAGLMNEAAMARAKLDKLQPAHAHAQHGSAHQTSRTRGKGADSRGKKPTQARNPTRVPAAESPAPQAAQTGSRVLNGSKGSADTHRKSPAVPTVGASNSGTHRPVAAWLEKRGKGRFTAAVCTLFGQTDESPTEWVDTLERMERSGLVDGLLAALESDGQVDSGGGGKRVYAPNDVRNKKNDAAGQQTKQQGKQAESKRNQQGSNRNQSMCEQKELDGDKRKDSFATEKISIEKQRQQRQAEHAASSSKRGGEQASAMRHARQSEDKAVGRNAIRDAKDSQRRARASRGGSMLEPEPEPDPPAGKQRGAQTRAQAQREVTGEVPTRNEKMMHPKKSAARKQPIRSTDSSCEVSSAADGELHTSTMSIYVSNISWDTDELALQNVFSQFGAVKHVKHFDNKSSTAQRSGRRPGYAFIEFSTAASAQAAINASLDLGITLDDRELKVQRVKSERKFSGDKSVGNNHRTRPQQQQQQQQQQQPQPQQGTLRSGTERVGPQRPLSPPQRIPREASRAKSQGRSGRAKSTPRGVSTRVESTAYPSSASATAQRDHQGQQRVYAVNDMRNIANRTSQAVQRPPSGEGRRVGQTTGSPERSTRASVRAKSASRNTRNSQQRQRSDTNSRRTDQGAAPPYAAAPSTPRSMSPSTRGRSAAAVRSRSTPRQGRRQCDASTDSTGDPDTINRVSSNASARADGAGVDRAGAVRNIGPSHSPAADHEQRLEATQMMRTAALSGDKVSLKAAIAWAEASPIKKSLEGDLAMARMKLQKMG